MNLWNKYGELSFTFYSKILQEHILQEGGNFPYMNVWCSNRSDFCTLQDLTHNQILSRVRVCISREKEEETSWYFSIWIAGLRRYLLEECWDPTLGHPPGWFFQKGSQILYALQSLGLKHFTMRIPQRIPSIYFVFLNTFIICWIIHLNFSHFFLNIQPHFTSRK